MTLDSDKDITAIKEWISKEPYLPQDFDDETIAKFLHSCFGSLEQTKQCIERFSSGRYNMPEVYIGRDPRLDKLQTAFSITNVTTFLAGQDEILIHYLDASDLDKVEFYSCLKTMSIQADYWIKVGEPNREGHIVILNIKWYTLRLVAKSNIFLFQKFLVFLLEGMPVRLKQIHVVNCPSYYEKLYALVKGVLPQEICDLIHFHKSHEGLHSFVDRQYLPAEYGGDGSSMQQQQRDWIDIIMKNRQLFCNDNMWKADLTKKPKKNGEDVMNGSFRTLSID